MLITRVPLFFYIYPIAYMQKQICCSERGSFFCLPCGRGRERPKTTYLQVIQTQLKRKHFQTLEDAMIEARDTAIATTHHHLKEHPDIHQQKAVQHVIKRAIILSHYTRIPGSIKEQRVQVRTELLTGHHHKKTSKADKHHLVQSTIQ